MEDELQKRIQSQSQTSKSKTGTSVEPPLQASTALTPYLDAARFNDSFDWGTGIGLPKHIGDLVGGSVRGKPVLPHGANEPGTVRWQR